MFLSCWESNFADCLCQWPWRAQNFLLAAMVTWHDPSWQRGIGWNHLDLVIKPGKQKCQINVPFDLSSVGDLPVHSDDRPYRPAYPIRKQGVPPQIIFSHEGPWLSTVPWSGMVAFFDTRFWETSIRIPLIFPITYPLNDGLYGWDVNWMLEILIHKNGYI